MVYGARLAPEHGPPVHGPVSYPIICQRLASVRCFNLSDRHAADAEPIARFAICSMTRLMVCAHRPHCTLLPRQPKIWLIRGR